MGETILADHVTGSELNNLRERETEFANRFSGVPFHFQVG